VPQTSKWFRIKPAVVAVLFLYSVAASAQEPWEAPADESARENPREATDESLASGKEVFEGKCTPCHGSKGKGDGPLAATLGVDPRNLSDPKSLEGKSDGDLHWKISTGRNPMPAFDGDVPDDQIWDVINYVRTLSAKKRSRRSRP
jgi:mono/diheme cytochrome c family protein